VDEVQCELCGGWFRTITWTHLDTVHGTTTGEYRKKFPNAPMQALDYIEARVGVTRGITWGPEYCELHSKRTQEYWDNLPVGVRNHNLV
jgi:predicted transcriptional regulator